jgi:hypothetical protein
MVDGSISEYQMDRRSFLTAGTGLVAAGAAATAALTGGSRSAYAGSRNSPNIYDFGAVGDGNTDDSGAFTKALTYASQNGGMVIVPAGSYAIANTIAVTVTNNTGRAWGLQCEGATLYSKISNGSDVILLSSTAIVRYFRLVGGMSITGNGSEANGLHIQVNTNGPSFYNFLIEGLSVERCGQNGGLFEGNVFECAVENSYFQDNGQDGFMLANHSGGVISTVHFVNCYLNQNGRYGLSTVSFDGQYGGPQDVNVFGGYIRNNQSYGLYLNNGTGTHWIQHAEFENNCASLQPGDPNGAHVYALTNVNMRDCVGFDMTGGATYLLRGWWMQLTCLDGCSNWSDGPMAQTGATRLVQINGNGNAHVVMNQCGGGFDGVSGCGVTWQAINCGGPSPAGDLNIRGTMSGTF